MWRKRVLILWVLTGVITILCHANAFAPDNRGAFSINKVLKPSAHDDFVSTLEDTPVSVDVLTNDTEDKREDEERRIIDPSTIDLDPRTNEIDRTFANNKGIFTANEAGSVRYEPASNFNGTSTITYTVSDRGGERSNDAKINFLVQGVNDPPVITGQNPDPITINEGQSFAIAFSHLLVTDPDNSYPSGFTLTVNDGTGYSRNGNTITPNNGFVGTLSVPVFVSDGQASSNTYSLQVVVANVNDAPQIVGQNPDPLTVLEDQTFSINLGHLQVNDPDNSYPTGFSLLVAAGSNYSVNGSSITPSQNFAGTLSIPVQVNDGQALSNTFPFQVVVQNVNDAPIITGQTSNPISIGEEQSLTITLNHLNVSDPDDQYPNDFSVTVGAGANYSVNGNTITPNTDFTGNLSIPVVVNDGESNSNTFSLVVSVGASNDAPQITSHNPIRVDEDNATRILLTDLVVSDADSNYPSDFTLTILTGSNYTVSGSTIIPAPDFFGILSVPVQVNDGFNDSNVFNVSITVNPINDAPVISGQQSLTTPENQPFELRLEYLTVTDPDNNYPQDFSIAVAQGTNYSVSGSVISPAPGYSGVLSVPVTVSDGAISSNSFDVQIDVSSVNDPPVITGQNSLTVVEDNSITIQLSDLLVTDSDNTYPDGFSLDVQPGSSYSLSDNSVLPAPNFAGSLSVGVIVNDGSSDSQPFSLVVDVTPVNDAPAITGQQTLTTQEDQPIAIQLTDLIVSDPDNVYPNGFTLTLSAGDNYVINENTVTPDSDFKGVLEIPSQVNDGELNSNAFVLHVSVTDVNDPPVITGQRIVSTEEDVPVTILLSDLTVFDADSPFPSGFRLNVLPGENYSVSGNTITPARDFTGTLNVTVTVNDGTSDSAPFVFQIQVGNSNDPPVITGQVNATTNEEQVFVLQLSHLTVSDPDNSYPNGFSLLAGAGPNYTVVDNAITPVINFFGTLIVPVRVNDGVNNSATFDFHLEVLPVNDPPSFDVIGNVNVSENAPPGKVSILNISKGPNEGAQSVTFSASSSDPEIVPHPVITYNGSSPTASLAYIVNPNKSGLVTINVVATDNGGNTAPNQNTFSSSFQISVAEINSAPTLDVVAAQTINEDSPLITIPLTGITSGAGEVQDISIVATTNRPELLEILSVQYSSPGSSGGLQVKPLANANGVAQITLTVTDDGSNTAPSVNFITRSFTLSILPINDPPVFVSRPVTVAAVQEQYEYIVEIEDEESESLSITAEQKPSWSSLTTISGKKARLAGVPPISATGNTDVKLVVKDGLYTVDQTFELIVNSRPTVTTFTLTTEEDTELRFSQTNFSGAYSDVNQHAIQAIQIIELPVSGSLLLTDIPVQPLDTIDIGLVGSLVYKPDKDYYGDDTFKWKASDGYHFSSSAANVNVIVHPVNDPPVITMETDTLQYEINGESAFLTTVFDVVDPDNDSLSSAEIMFVGTNYQAEYDLLTFENSANVKVTYDLRDGKLSLRGTAPIAEYRDVIRQIKYSHLNTLDPYLKMKVLSFVVDDGKLSSEIVNRFMAMRFTFVDLDIPNGFTPNGDNANDTWIISRPGGVQDFHNAIISVFNKRGSLVYRGVGFSNPWDGKLDGESLPAGTYYFTIDLKLRSRKIYKGVVTILR